MTTLAWARERNHSALRHSSRNLPLKLSATRPCSPRSTDHRPYQRDRADRRPRRTRPAPSDHPWDLAAGSDSAARGNRRRPAVPAGSRPCCLARIGASAAFNRRQDHAARHQQARQSIYPAPAYPWCTLVRDPSRSGARWLGAMDRCLACQDAHQQGNRGNRGQDRPHRVGRRDQAGRSLRTQRLGRRLTAGAGRKRGSRK